MEKTRFNIPSLSCSNCAEKIQGELKSLHGVQNVSTDLKSQSVEIEFNPMDITPADIRTKLSSLGYEVLG